MTEEQLVLTEEQLAEVMNNLEQWFDKFEPEVRLYGHVALQAIRQLWAEREGQRAVMAQAKPVEVWELAAIISDAVHDNPFAILSEKSPLTAEQERKRASAILSRYNVTKKEEV